MNPFEKLEIPSTTFKVPSGFDVTIREQDGGDDETLSKVANQKDSSAINRFVSGIIIGTSLEGFEKGISPTEIEKWKVNDKYLVALKSRIFSIGSEVQYSNKCPNTLCNAETDYTEDLSLYDWDLNLPSPRPEEPDYNRERIRSYPVPHTETNKSITLSSGKLLRYKYKTGQGEKILLEIGQDNLSNNSKLIARELEYRDPQSNKWVKVSNFKFLSKKDMTELIKDINTNDWEFQALTEATCPKCGTKSRISIVAQPGFFFPEEI